MEEEVHYTRVAKIWRRRDGIVQEDFNKNAEVNKDDVLDIVKIANDFYAENKNLVFVDISDIKSVTYEARNYLKSDEAFMNVKAVAYKVHSRSSVIIGNFLNTVNKPQFPTKLFTSENKAVSWLKSF